MRICIVIPTYNEAMTIAKIVQELKKNNLEVLVIDDGSSDGTAQLALDSGAAVLRNKRNEGKGASLVRGFEHVLTRDFDAAITMDGDGQHLPEDIVYFMRLAEYPATGVVVGNRMHNLKNMPRLRILTNKVMSWFISKIAEQKIPDSQCGYRLIKREVLERLNLTTSRFETESELLLNAAYLGYRIESVPIQTIYGGQKSQINPFIDTLRFVRFLFSKRGIFSFRKKVAR